ncbi:MAG TPA: tetratricopeptide repeat protein, partial [Duganella sp.]
AAAEAFDRSIALQPDQLDARNAQAVLLASQGRQDEAIALLQQLVAVFPREAQPLNNLGYLYYLQGQPERARAALAQALRLDPLHAQARANLARLTPGAAAPAAAAPGAAPELLAAADTATPSRLQLVQLAPNEFRLQERLAAAPATAHAKVDAATAVATAATMITASLPAAPVDPDAGSALIQIVNGNGVPGLGQRTRRLLARSDRLGAANADVVNKRRPDQRDTIIEYLPGQRERARLMRIALPVRATLLPVRGLPGRLALRLVLGHDHTNATAKLRAASRTTPVARPARTARATGAPRPTLLTRDRQPQRLPGAALLTMHSTAVPHFNQE